MSRIRNLTSLALACVVALAFASDAHAQIVSARRMAMGGVALMHGGSGGDAANVAYRAVPADPRQHVASLSLPIGVIQTLQDKPTFDTNDSTFSAFRIANLALHLPWNYALTKPTEPEGDVTITIARNSLGIDLGTLREVVPDERMRFAMVMRGPGANLNIRRAFIGVGPYVIVKNDFDLDANLRAALRDAVPFAPLTTYGLQDQGVGQAAAQAMLGAAFPLAHAADAQSRDGVYVGARARLLRGLAYGDVNETVSFTTADTIFGDAPLDVNLRGRMRSAMPADGGFGHGFDAGVVIVVHGLEVGVAANDLGTSIDWKVKETQTAKDTTSGDYKTTTVAENVAFTSTVTATYLLTASTYVGPIYVAADAQRDGLEIVTGHVGAEWWVGPLALRGGAWNDTRQQVQVSGGVGLRFGRIGVDLAVASNQTNLTHERTLDLGAGLSWYPRRKS